MLIKMRLVQLPLARRHGWGGKRLGAGRKRKDGTTERGVPHLRRPPLASRHPVGITLKVRRDVASLRAPASVSALRRALEAIRARSGFRVVHFSIQSNHVHLLVEAHDRVALSRGMQALQIRAARALNLAQGRRGRVFADRFHARILRTPTEVANVRGYVLENLAVHHARSGDDRFVEDKLTSEWMPTCASPPTTWLLSIGWRRSRRPRGAPPGH
jgi:REP element-mobilizing transposase RayT